MDRETLYSRVDWNVVKLRWHGEEEFLKKSINTSTDSAHFYYDLRHCTHRSTKVFRCLDLASWSESALGHKFLCKDLEVELLDPSRQP